MNKGYGYRMFLDDLPSATIMDGTAYYDTHIPLGYIKWTEPGVNGTSSTPSKGFFGGLPYKLSPKTYIYNHLDIEVTIHETGATQIAGRSYGESQITIDLENYGKFTVPLPDASVRIVGFTVEPRSIPNNVRCRDGLLDYKDEDLEGGLQLLPEDG